MKRIAVLLTTFNRREKTLTCLRSLQQQVLPADMQLDIFLTDDASSDGTAQAVQSAFPGVNLFSGNGSFYWAGGMRHTWRQALATRPDHYLLLNDDTTLVPGAIAVLLQPGEKEGPCICIGSTASEGQISYGGWRLRSRRFWKSERVQDDRIYADCDFGNANIMLIPKEVVDRIGILAAHFTHSLADYDYTLKARKAGFRIKVAPGFLGSCVDDHGNNWKSAGTTLKERIRYLKSVKGLAYHEYLRFIRDHFPLSYPSAFFKLWMKTFFPFIWDRFKGERAGNTQ
jgi:GT2 family glycosyltransferase